MKINGILVFEEDEAFFCTLFLMIGYTLSLLVFIAIFSAIWRPTLLASVGMSIIPALITTLGIYIGILNT